MEKAKPSGEKLDVIVEFNNDRYDISTTTEDTLKGLKNLIYTVTKVPTYRQFFLNIGFSAVTKSDKSILKDLNITSRFVLKMKDLLREPSPSSIPEAGDSATRSPRTSHPRVLRRRNYMKVVGKPRQGKKLVVVDIDQTIYDRDVSAENLSGRPYFQEFLAQIYQEYDIAVWSATDMRSLEYKLCVLGIDRHPDYKLLFYLDVRSTVSILILGGEIQAKPLNVIWKEFPQFNSKNTIICDDRQENFFFNSKNGILVSAYFTEDYDKDDELLKLGTYLKNIAKSNDLGAFDHRVWRLETDAGEEDDPHAENPGGNGSKGDAPAGDATVGDVPVGDAPVGDTFKGDTPVGDTPVGDTPVGDIPVGDTPVDDTLAGDTPAGDAPEEDKGNNIIKVDTSKADTSHGDVPKVDTAEKSYKD
ncbi:hypothetical protein ILUMI_10824 [Ignelater luminosus]|uniref:FCP1 homology domain-containing protein n=1 Tax=Ignelater luminosus TaxID=2038154 RepID=A0A8K0GD95_IGNLU|nr:hypothetical protein ILUMI_10824 [Ignelater luminosus]